MKYDYLKEFKEAFIQDHNKGEERFLRGLYIEEFEGFLSQMATQIKEETMEEVYSKINERERDLKKEWDAKKDDKKYSQVHLACLDGRRMEAAWILSLLTRGR